MNTLTLHTTRTTTLDALKTGQDSLGIQVLGIIGFALLTALGAQIKLYLFEVPFTLQTLFVYGSGLFLGWRNGLFAQLLYILLGFAFPVYAGGTIGIAYFYTAYSAGYLLAFPLVAFLVGKLSTQWNTLLGVTLAMACGSVLLFLSGVTWLHEAAGHATWLESFTKGWFVFIPADLAKIFLTGLAYTGLRRLF